MCFLAVAAVKNEHVPTPYNRSRLSSALQSHSFSPLLSDTTPINDQSLWAPLALTSHLNGAALSSHLRHQFLPTVLVHQTQRKTRKDRPSPTEPSRRRFRRRIRQSRRRQEDWGGARAGGEASQSSASRLRSGCFDCFSCRVCCFVGRIYPSYLGTAHPCVPAGVFNRSVRGLLRICSGAAKEFGIGIASSIV